MELETAQLRNKLTMIDKKLENGTSKFNWFYWTDKLSWNMVVFFENV